MNGFAFPAGTQLFLANLAENNDKAWFDAHRKDYEAYYVHLDGSSTLATMSWPRVSATGGPCSPHRWLADHVQEIR